jgi:hypothetical protein
VQDNLLALPVRKKGSRERRIAIVASSLVLVGGSAGMAAAAQNALPGEALYPIKRGLEKAQTGLATSRADQGKNLLHQADSRLVEVRGLVDSSADLSQVPATIDDFRTQALEASEVLLKEFETSREPALIEELRTFAADNLEELQELAKSAEPEHQDELALAAEALMAIDSRAQEVCPSCADQLQNLKMPPLFLAASDAVKAMESAGGAVVDNSHPVITGDVAGNPGAGKGSSPDGKGGKNGKGGTGATGDDAPDEVTGNDLPSGDVDTNAPEGGKPDILGDILGGGKGDDTKGGKGGKSDTGKGGKGDGGKVGIGTKVKELLPEELKDVLGLLP